MLSKMEVMLLGCYLRTTSLSHSVFLMPFDVEKSPEQSKGFLQKSRHLLFAVDLEDHRIRMKCNTLQVCSV